MIISTKEREVELTRELRNALGGNLRYGYILQLYKCVSTVCYPLGQGDVLGGYFLLKGRKRVLEYKYSESWGLGFVYSYSYSYSYSRHEYEYSTQYSVSSTHWTHQYSHMWAAPATVCLKEYRLWYTLIILPYSQMNWVLHVMLGVSDKTRYMMNNYYSTVSRDLAQIWLLSWQLTHKTTATVHDSSSHKDVRKTG